MSDKAKAPPSTQTKKDQRESVKRTMEEATQDQPSEFRDEANEDKKVHIPPVTEKNPIQGLDP
jgi:hypothetical protein